AAGACGPGPEQCVTDDATDDTPGDDGPAAARDLTDDVDVPHTLSDGRICSAPGTELDSYKVTTTDAGEGLSVDLTWTGTTTDLDLRVFDATGAVLGLSFYGSEAEHVVLDYLPVGTYYIEVSEFTDAPETATVAYEITATRATAVACDMDSDCDDTYSTQVFRGDCVGGACQFLAGAGALTQGTACDSGDDCTSGRCSYVPFESDAAASVCTVTCTTTANCAALGGSFTCTTGLGTNFCVPGCADDLQCGALVSSSVPDSGQPWDYATCTSNVCGF
ncbi:MAG TPA: PPC domain-containing protein, partial [Kofleriaceae bacterium]|nr:PPC domain-containing protein [Kofleriaceae bacterium]